MAKSNALKAVKKLGTSRELLWDEEMIAEKDGVSLTLHRSVAREVSLVHDAPWEGNVCCYHTILRDDAGKYRMYYRGATYKMGEDHPQVSCCAISDDGITWTKPDLGLFEFKGSTHNNIVWMGDSAAHNFTPFLDTNPACEADCRYKAIGGDQKSGLRLYVSSDGFHWKQFGDQPIIKEGLFDSQNTACYDNVRQCYVSYSRTLLPVVSGIYFRAIQRCISTDMLHWSHPELIEFVDGEPEMELYTNAILPYYRCPQVMVGFPKRFVPNRKTAYDLFGGDGLPGMSDGLFMSSRDGMRFHRCPEAFVRPGLQHERWINRNNMTAWGLVETPSDIPGTPNELSIYTTEAYYSEQPNRIRRMTIRLDGFISVQAPYAGGSFTTKLLSFDADADDVSLLLNASTSGAGCITCEILDGEGVPVPGFSMDESIPVYADDIDIPMAWKNGGSLKELVGKPISLRFNMVDADIYSFRFGTL
ncbi:MAG: hypothetical protein J6X55_13945 [Victivallales bacterium]|nr:hypothetical protein [Victivallales bacterium]